MTQILDEIEIKHHQTKFSKLSFAVSLMTLALGCFLFLSIPSSINVAEGYQDPPMALIIVTQFSCLIGIIMMVLSIAKKEPATWYKWVGGVLNTILLLFIVGINFAPLF